MLFWCRRRRVKGWDNPVTTKMYVTGDLAFYTMVLGRKSSSGQRCSICRMSAKQFTKCTEVGETRTYKLMNEFFAKMKSDKQKKPIEGCWEEACWQMIPLANFLFVPLLHKGWTAWREGQPSMWGDGGGCQFYDDVYGWSWLLYCFFFMCERGKGNAAISIYIAS